MPQKRRAILNNSTCTVKVCQRSTRVAVRPIGRGCREDYNQGFAIGGQRAYFDTNTSNHNHYFIEGDGKLMDIPGDSIRVDGLPEPPENLRISHIDVVVRLVAK